MSEIIIKVRVAEYKTGSSPAIFKCFGLGSCVGVALYDAPLKIGGMAHVLLPSHDPAAPGESGEKPRNPLKYANLALHTMLSELLAMGCMRERLTAKIAGGANMFSSTFQNMPGTPVKQGIGERNVQSVRDTLQDLHIPIVAEDVGGQKGRTLQFDTASGRILVTSTWGDSLVL